MANKDRLNSSSKDQVLKCSSPEKNAERYMTKCPSKKTPQTYEAKRGSLHSIQEATKEARCLCHNTCTVRSQVSYITCSSSLQRCH